MDGGVSNQQAIHHIDALNWLNGPVEKVTAFSTRRMNTLEAEDTLVASLIFNNGSLGTIEVTTAARPEDFEASLSIVGERGMAIIGGVALNELQQWEFINKDPDDDLATERFSQAVPNGYGLGHIPLLNEISNSLKSNSIIPPLNALEGAKAVELVHALYASIELNKTIELDKKIRSRQLGK
jgi:Predicted dehydrogenases and related proteins